MDVALGHTADFKGRMCREEIIQREEVMGRSACVSWGFSSGSTHAWNYGCRLKSGIIFRQIIFFCHATAKNHV